MVKKWIRLCLIMFLLVPVNMPIVHAETPMQEEDMLLQMDVMEETLEVQEESLPQARTYGSMVYLEAGNILNYGTGTYLYDYGMNAVTISYAGTSSLALIQELYLNGLRVYCIEPEVLTANGAGYQMGVANGLVSNDERRTLGLTSYFGYGYNGDTSDAMNAATIVAVWMARGRTISDVSDEVMNKVHQIQTRVANVDVHPSFEREEIQLKGYGKQYAVTLTDTNGVLEDYHIYQDGGYTIEKNGNSLKVWLENGKKSTGKIVFDRIERSSQGNQVVYVNPDGKQTLMRISAQSSESVEFQPSLLKGGLRIFKQNEDGESVPNTSFQLSYHVDMSNPIGTFTTNQYGYADIDQLEPMDVYVKEIAVPDPYVVDSTIEKLVIKGGETIHFTKVNRYKKGNVRIIKKDTSTNQVVVTANSQFDIYTAQHQFVERITTDSTGMAMSKDLRYGAYYIKEVLAPNGYLGNDSPLYFDISEDQVIIEKECFDARVQAKISVHKQDAVSGDYAQGDATLEGAIYGLYAAEPILAPDDHHEVYAKDTLLEQKAIQDGNITFDNLLLGKYYVKELVPSNGYTLDTNVYPIDCSYENQYVELIHKQQTVLERVKSQAFQIIKVSTDGTTSEIPALAGAEFTIKLKQDVERLGWEFAPIAKNANDEETTRLVTDEKGYAISQELPYGTYIVKETSTPVGTTTVKDFEVTIQEDNREPQVWRIFNDAPIKAHIKVVKIDEETGKVITTPFIKFKIRNLDTMEYVKFWIKYPSSHILDTFETDASGSFTTPEGLPYGHYQVEEIQAPHGYVLDETPLTFEINDNSAYETMEDETNVQIVLKKVNKQVKGNIQIEKKANILSHFDFQMSEFGKIYQPVWEEGYLDGVSFDIYAKEDIETPDGTVWYHANDKVETCVTTKEGPVLSKALPLGTYIVKEVSTKEGYLVNPKEFEVALTYANQNVPIVTEIISLWNEKEKGEVEFLKQFEETPFQSSQEALQHTYFGVFLTSPLRIDEQTYLQADDMLGVIALNDEAKGNFTLDFAGEYYVKELQSDDAYVLDETKYPVTFAYQQKNQQITLDQPIYNKTKKGNLKITKVDDKETPIAGVVFELSLTKDFQDIFMEKTSDSNGYVMFDELAYGTYFLREKATGALYVLDDNIRELNIDQSEIALDILNYVRKSAIHIHKIDDSHQSLAGVEFSLYDDAGVLLQTKESDENGDVFFQDLSNATYHVKETKALPNYQEVKDTLDIVIEGNDQGRIYEYEVMNTYIVKTGQSESPINYGVMFCFGLVIFYFVGKRKNLVGQNNSIHGVQRIK